MLKLTYFGHSAFKIENESFSIVFDPYQDNSVPGLTFPHDQKCNYLSISHEHGDHNARELVEVESKIGPRIFDYLVPHDKQNGTKRGMNRVRIVQINGVKIAHLGDIGDTRNREWVNPLNGVDVILCPINGFYTIGANEAINLMNLVKPKLFIPMHYYNKDNNSGYEDGDQIEIFKKEVGNYKATDDYEVDILEEIKEPKVLILNKCKQ